MINTVKNIIIIINLIIFIGCSESNKDKIDDFNDITLYDTDTTRYLYRPNISLGWGLIYGEHIYKENTYIFYTANDSMIDTVKTWFDLENIDVITDAKKIEVVVFSIFEGIDEKDLLIFKDEFDNVLFAKSITFGSLQLAYKLQSRFIRPILK
ncbi:hypothetical protein K9N50_02480 [bacterium]|nr:hypothetical protein [bacterium]